MHGLEVDELFGFVARFDIVDACCELKDTFDAMHDLGKTPLEASCDVYVHEEYLPWF